MLDKTTRISLLRDMLYVRRTEERIMALYAEQEMRCPTHFSIGQEAISAAVCQHLDHDDYAISAHRSHAHYLNKGGDLKAMVAELYGKETGCAHGKGGSMHLIDLSVNFIGCVPIVGSTIPIGVGAAFGTALQDTNRLSAVFFGDGAVETGIFYEAVNWAVVQNLPVVFVCENNQYSVNTPLSVRQPASRTIRQLAEGLGVTAYEADGQLIEEVYAVAGKAVAHVRAGKGPVLMEFQTYRWLEHCGPLPDLHLAYRPEGEFEHWEKRDPIVLYRAKLIEEGVIDDAAIDDITADIDARVEAAVAFAKASPFPQRSELTAHLYA